MEQSEQQKKAISLGKLLVQELGIENRVDTLARWMAHYLADLFIKIDNSKGSAKKKLEREVFELILKLWKHRWSMPNGSRPFENFLPLFELLQRLDVENSDHYFYNEPKFRKKSPEAKQSKKEKRLNDWLQMAAGIDKVARIWLSEVLRQAAISSTDAKTITWLKNAVIVPSDYDRQIIVNIIRDGLPDLDDQDNMDELNGRLTKETITSRLKQLVAFKELNEQLIRIYEKQLTS